MISLQITRVGKPTGGDLSTNALPQHVHYITRNSGVG